MNHTINHRTELQLKHKYPEPILMQTSKWEGGAGLPPRMNAQSRRWNLKETSDYLPQVSLHGCGALHTGSPTLSHPSRGRWRTRPSPEDSALGDSPPRLHSGTGKNVSDTVSAPWLKLAAPVTNHADAVRQAEHLSPAPREPRAPVSPGDTRQTQLWDTDTRPAFLKVPRSREPRKDRGGGLTDQIEPQDLLNITVS